MKRFLIFTGLVLLIACKKDKIDTGKTQPADTGIPQLLTQPITNLTHYSVTFHGSITDTGFSKITEAGFVVDTLPEPTITRNLNKFIRVQGPNHSLSAIIIDVPAGKNYYIKAYAINAQGIGYGNQVSFMAEFENAYTGNVTLQTQQDVINFGNSKYTRIKGALYISGSVTDLTPLLGLAIIDYELNVTNTTALKNLKGLDSLQATNSAGFYHGMLFENNSALTSFAGLNNLIGSYGDFDIINNTALTSLSGLDKVSFSDFGEFRIQGCNLLTNLNGLENLAFLDGSIYLMDNTGLTNIGALGNLSTVTGYIYIIDDQALTNLHGFEKLTQAENITLTNNDKLVDLTGIGNITALQSIEINGNNSLKDLSGFSKITTIEFFELQNNNSLTNLSGLNNLTTVTGNMNIEQNSKLVNLAGLNKLTSVPYISIQFNNSLVDLTGLNALTTCTGNASSMVIAANNSLTSLTGLENLATVGGEIQINYNPAIKSFCGLAPLLRSNWSGTFLDIGNDVNPAVSDIVANCK
jgi:hypothetical protein